MKTEGYPFPALRESDAMFTADRAPSWIDGDNCYRCRTQFTLVIRKVPCPLPPPCLPNLHTKLMDCCFLEIFCCFLRRAAPLQGVRPSVLQQVHEPLVHAA